MGTAAANFKKTMHQKTPEEFTQMLKAAGFNKSTIEIIEKPSYFDTFQTFVQWFMAWIPNCTQLPHDQALKVSQALVTYLYKQNNIVFDQPITCPIHFLEVHAH